MKTTQRHIHTREKLAKYLAFSASVCLAAGASAMEVNKGKSLAPDTATGVPYSWHQADVLSDFKIADANQDGYLDESEYSFFAKRRIAKSKAYEATRHQEQVLGITDTTPTEKPMSTSEASTKAKMPASRHQRQVMRDFAKLDRNKDAQAGFLEVYYFETFDRPSVFPPRDESIPQETVGHWETLIREKHPPVNQEPAFSADVLRKSLAEGGFSSVDENDDGYVSIFEAGDRSMLYWTRNIYQFEAADMDGNWLLTKQEFGEFQDMIKKNREEASRGTQYPPAES